MREGQRHKILAITAVVVAAIWFKFVFGLPYPFWQLAGVLVIMELLMLFTVWLPIRKKHRKRRSSRSDPGAALSKAELAKYEQLS